jgi:hypothetical protein
MPHAQLHLHLLLCLESFPQRFYHFLVAHCQLHLLRVPFVIHHLSKAGQQLTAMLVTYKISGIF